MRSVAAARDAARPSLGKLAFYRTCRLLHAYLSAFAFLALIFFSATGLLLNHSDWLQGTQAANGERTISLTADDVRQAVQSPEPATALIKSVARIIPLLGAYKSSEIVENEANLRLEGVRGTSDIAVNLKTGLTTVRIEPASITAMLNDLHRGKNAGVAWAAVIDATAILLLAVSVVGFILFFSLRMRLGNTLMLTAGSVLAGGGIFYLFVP